jgi:hypothetical protein
MIDDSEITVGTKLSLGTLQGHQIITVSSVRDGPDNRGKLVDYRVGKSPQVYTEPIFRFKLRASVIEDIKEK